jgi:hypothetical protein
VPIDASKTGIGARSAILNRCQATLPCSTDQRRAAKMRKVDEAAISKRAKKLCEEDGYDWDVEFKLPLPKGTKIKLKPFLDEVGRRKYLAHAQEQLLKECAEDA